MWLLSDIRAILVGVALVFAGFLVLGIFGDEYREAGIQSSEFDECIRFSDDGEQQIDCEQAVGESVAFFAVVLAILGAGIYALVRGYRGKWDNEAKPEEMLGPGGDRPGGASPDKDDSS